MPTAAPELAGRHAQADGLASAIAKHGSGTSRGPLEEIHLSSTRQVDMHGGCMDLARRLDRLRVRRTPVATRLHRTFIQAGRHLHL